MYRYLQNVKKYAFLANKEDSIYKDLLTPESNKSLNYYLAEYYGILAQDQLESNNNVRIESLKKLETELSKEDINDLSEISSRLVNFLSYLEPFGPKNPKPKFVSKNVVVEGLPKVIGRDKTTIRFKVKQNHSIFDAIAFRMIEEYEKLISGKDIDIVYTISENYWRGKTSLQLEIKGIKYSNAKN